MAIFTVLFALTHLCFFLGKFRDGTNEILKSWLMLIRLFLITTPRAERRDGTRRSSLEIWLVEDSANT